MFLAQAGCSHWRRESTESRETPRPGTLAMRRLARVMSVDEKIKRVLLESNGQWLSARQLAEMMGVSYQAIARRLFKLALFSEIDMQEIELVKERHRVRKSHMYRAWGGWAAYPSWMAPRGCESEVKRARLVIGRASLRNEET